MNFITLKELKKMVPVASEFKRVPGLKKILEDGIEVVLRKQMEHHAEVVVYKNGYVSYHPCVYIVQIVPLRQHRDQFVAKDQRNDDSCNRNHHRIRNVTDHAENTAVPPLRCLPDLSSDLTGLLVDRCEHRTQVRLHHAGKKFPHPFFDCCENIIEQWRVFLLSLVD